MALEAHGVRHWLVGPGYQSGIVMRYHLVNKRSSKYSTSRLTCILFPAPLWRRNSRRAMLSATVNRPIVWLYSFVFWASLPACDEALKTKRYSRAIGQLSASQAHSFMPFRTVIAFSLTFSTFKGAMSLPCLHPCGISLLPAYRNSPFVRWSLIACDATREEALALRGRTLKKVRDLFHCVLLPTLPIVLTH